LVTERELTEDERTLIEGLRRLADDVSIAPGPEGVAAAREAGLPAVSAFAGAPASLAAGLADLLLALAVDTRTPGALAGSATEFASTLAYLPRLHIASQRAALDAFMAAVRAATLASAAARMESGA
jgi:hypothetical protein